MTTVLNNFQCNPGIVPPHLQEALYACGQRAGDQALMDNVISVQQDLMARVVANDPKAAAYDGYYGGLKFAPMEKLSLEEDGSTGLPRDPRPGIPDRNVFDVENMTILPGKRIIKEGDIANDVTTDESARFVYGVSPYVIGYLRDHQDTNSLDGKGRDTNQAVHYGADWVRGGYNNASWNGWIMSYGDGDNKIFRYFGLAQDVGVHEPFHGYTEYNAGRDHLSANSIGEVAADAIVYGGMEYFGMSGAGNEAYSDIGAKLVAIYRLSKEAGKKLSLNEVIAKLAAEGTDFWNLGPECMIGNNIDGSKSAIRNLGPKPGFDRKDIGRDPSTKDMAHYDKGSRDNYGVHINSGILLHAFYIQALELADTYLPETLGKIWQDGQRDLHNKVNFKEIAAVLLARTQRIFPGDERILNAMKKGFDDVGITGANAIEIDEIHEIASNDRVRIFDDRKDKHSSGDDVITIHDDKGNEIFTIGRSLNGNVASTARATISKHDNLFSNMPDVTRVALGVKNRTTPVALVYVKDLAALNSRRGRRLTNIDGLPLVFVQDAGAKGFTFV